MATRECGCCKRKWAKSQCLISQQKKNCLASAAAHIHLNPMVFPASVKAPVVRPQRGVKLSVRGADFTNSQLTADFLMPDNDDSLENHTAGMDASN